MRVSRRGPFIKDKIKSPGQLEKIISALKVKGKKVVFTNGCFDLLHYGHVHYLEEAKKKGDYLVVALNSDASLRRIKGKPRPIVGQNYRARVIAALASVDFVTIFEENTPLKIINLLKPDILVKGEDWKDKGIVGSDVIRAYGGKVVTIKLIAGCSTTGIVQKIAQAL